MKGHMQDGKFHPHTDYKKGVRKSRDQQEKTQGVIRLARSSKLSEKQAKNFWNRLTPRSKFDVLTLELDLFLGNIPEHNEGKSFFDRSFDELPIKYQSLIRSRTLKQLNRVTGLKGTPVQAFSPLSVKVERKERTPKIQKLELLEPFIPDWTDPNGIKARYAHFDKLPVDIAESLLTGEPNIDPKGNQNNSPNARELVNLAKKHNGTVGGYFINSSDKSRDDHRITLETIYLNMNKKDAEALREKIFPDEFAQQKDGTWRFWWD